MTSKMRSHPCNSFLTVAELHLKLPSLVGKFDNYFYHDNVMIERIAIALPKKERYAYGTLRDRKCFFPIGDRLK
ncbi:MAG: hypothetical protein U7127_06525 [Phormidium sp.]